MSLRPVKDVRQSVATMEGAGVALRRAFGCRKHFPPGREGLTTHLPEARGVGGGLSRSGGRSHP